MNQLTVLCAVDNRDLARIYEKALTGEGFRVQVAHDGEQALCVVGESLPDLVVLDITLPKRDGFAVLESLRNDHDGSQTPVILLSDSRITPQYQQRADELGAALLLSKPVPLDQFLSEIIRLTKSGTPVMPNEAEQEIRASQDRKSKHKKLLAGSFEEIPFPQLLHELHGLRVSGVLMLAKGKKRKGIQLRDGYPIAVRSNLVPECLGNYLIRTGVIEEDVHRESLKRMKRGEGLQGQILVAMQVLDEDAVARALSAQALEKLFEIFEWSSGKFKLERGQRLQRANALSLDRSPANVILEGVRTRYPIAAIDRHLRGSEARFVVPAKSPFYRFQEIELGEQERELLSALDGTRRLDQFIAGNESVRRALFGLLVTGLVELDQGTEAVAQEPLRAAPTAEASSGPSPKEAALRNELTVMAQKLRDKNYYEVLGVPKNGALADIERSYSALAQRTHPDRFSKAGSGVRDLADELHELITSAHDTLRDAKSRKDYDLLLLKDEREAAREAAQEEKGRRFLAAETEFQKGHSLMKQRNYEEALFCFGKALEVNDRDGEYHAHYGWCLYLCHQDNSVMIEEAIEHVQRGVKLAREREKPYLYLGRLYKVVGKGTAAEKMFTRAVQIKPDCVEAMRELRLMNLRREKSRGLIGRLLRRSD